MLSAQSIEYVSTINNKRYTTQYDAESRQWKNVSPEGRSDSVVFDDKGKIVSLQRGDKLPAVMTYDDRGRLTKIIRGEGDETRSATLTYHESGEQQGYLESVTDALGRRMAFTTDPLGRVTSITQPDDRELIYNYDANGNLVRIVPPGRSAHVFQYNGVNKPTGYIPPAISGVETSTTYTYNLDKQLVNVLRPDGKTLNMTYGAGGRLATVVIPRGTYRYGYDPATGQLIQIEAPEGGLLDLTQDGSLPRSQAWSGEIDGRVTYEYNNDFLLQALSVNGLATNYDYDNDGLLTKAGELQITRGDVDELPIKTGLSNVESTLVYNGFEELISDTYRSQGDADVQISLNTAGISEDPLLIRGLVSGAGSITINDTPIALGLDGALSGSVPLPNIGKNTYTIKVYDKDSGLVGEYTQDVYRTEHTKTYYVDHIPAISPSGDVYFLTSDDGMYRLPSGSGTPEQPDWLVGGATSPSVAVESSIS